MPKTKTKTLFVCQECGCQSIKWIGRCPDCEKWNTFVEEIISKEATSKDRAFFREAPKHLSDVELGETPRITIGMEELDRILGGGIVSGSVILVGGEPGIGKSTLLLQACGLLSDQKNIVLYVSGEESLTQTKLRAGRLKKSFSSELYIVNETDLEVILEHVNKLKPKVVVIDSIQIVYKQELSSSAGSVSQVRECAGELVYLAKTKGAALFLVGHVTKEGSIAGPKVLEHMVDTVLYFEGERYSNFRVLRAVKNRFGPTNEIGIFQMTGQGLREVTNPSEIFLSERCDDTVGSAVVPTMEGTRPLLVEIQALVSATNFGMPRRWSQGVDYNRAVLLMAVLEKRLGLKLQNQDVYVNVAGGVKIVEPAADLGIAVAVASSLKELPTLPKVALLGEVGLQAEVRGVTQVEARIHEAEKLGFKSCIIPETNLKELSTKGDIKIIPVKTVDQALKAALKRKR